MFIFFDWVNLAWIYQKEKNYVLGYELLFIYNSEKTGNSLKAQQKYDI